MLIYRTHMHPESTVDPGHCTLKSDAKARSSWLHNHIKMVDKYEDVYSPYGDQHEDDTMEEDADTGLPDSTKLQPSGSGAQTARDTAAKTYERDAATTGATAGGTTTQGGTPHAGVTRLRFGTPDPPVLPTRELGRRHKQQHQHGTPEQVRTPQAAGSKLRGAR